MLPNTTRLALLLVAFACTEGDAPVARSYADAGSLCLSPRGAGGAHVQVLLNECGSSCEEVEASCSASVVDGVIVVESQGVARTVSNLCPGDCNLVDTACTLPELPEGNYELRYGARVATVTMPVPIAGTLVLLASDAAMDGDPCESLPLLP